MDHSSSIITQVSRDEEDSSTRRDEGEFGKVLKWSAAHDNVYGHSRAAAILMSVSTLKNEC